MAGRTDEFVVEAREHLSVVEVSLLALEKHPGAADASAHFGRCYRSVHSIKGDAGFMGFSRIHELSHAMESLLSGTAQPLPSSVIETLLSARDRLAVLVDDPARSQSIDISDLLPRLALNTSEPGRGPFEVNLAAWNASHPGGLGDFIRQTAIARKVQHGRVWINPCNLRDDLPTGPIRWSGIADVADGTEHVESLAVDLFDVSQRRGGLISWFRELNRLGRSITGQVQIPDTDLRVELPGRPIQWWGECETKLSSEELAHRLGLLPTQSTATTDDGTVASAAAGSNSTATKPTAAAPAAEGEKSTTLRIQVELLDRLMTLVGELTLVRNQSLLAFADEDGPQRAIIQRLNSVTSELQDATLRARMQPVGNLFNRFPRMVRDLARQLGKQVEIDLQGREVELDKTILEQLSDPLMHLIRNSVDHGIEMPEERIAKGKSPVGHIVLSATHEDGQVHIQIRDDGKGIDPQAVKAKALSLRLKTESELERMTPRDLFGLILLPGFSTAKKVTEVSGRGVGMDVVKTNIEQLEGTLNIDSVPGLGCSMVLRLPLTLAIIPCLIVTVGGHRFAVPQRDLEEVVCLHPQSPGRIETAFETEVYRLRDKLLPIVRLNEVLNRRAPFSPEAKAEILAAHAHDMDTQRIEYILVLKLAGRRFGLIVDEVRGTQEIVVKPLHASMKRVGIFTGATIMGDGRVALITDAEGIVEHARLSFQAAAESVAKVAAVRDAAQAHRVLLFEYGPQEQFALPLIQIRRIEMVGQDRIERVGDHEFVTVDGVSTRILRLNQVINASPLRVRIPRRCR